MVTFNVKDFRPILNSHKPSIIALSTNLTNDETDVKILKLLKTIKSNELFGHLISISKNGLTKKYDRQI